MSRTKRFTQCVPRYAVGNSGIGEAALMRELER